MATRMTPEARREQILETAHRVFLEEGYRQVSLRGIAARCGMSAPGLMHYFPDVRSLLIAVLERREERELGLLFRSDNKPRDPEQVLRSSLHGAVAYYQARDLEVGRFRILEGEAVDPAHPAHPFFAARFERNRTIIEEHLRATMANSDVMSYLICAALEGLRVQWDWNPRGFDIEAELDRIMPVLLAGVEPPRTGETP